MPPRLRAANLSPSVASSSRRPQSSSQVSRIARDFSQTSCHQATLRRRRMYEWMNTFGANLKDPIPGSTNYLGAYDKFGNLVRARPGWQRNKRASAVKEETQEAQ